MIKRQSSISRIMNKSSFGRSENDDHSAIDRIATSVNTNSLMALGAAWWCARLQLLKERMGSVVHTQCDASERTSVHDNVCH